MVSLIFLTRVAKLIEEKHLSIDRLRYLIIDASYRLKEKNLNIIDQYDTQVDFFTLIKQHLHTNVLENKIKLVLF